LHGIFPYFYFRPKGDKYKEFSGGKNDAGQLGSMDTWKKGLEHMCKNFPFSDQQNQQNPGEYNRFKLKQKPQTSCVHRVECSKRLYYKPLTTPTHTQADPHT
jgi:hypothetical protein